MGGAAPATQEEIENSCYWMRHMGATEDTVETFAALGRAWHVLPDEALMVVMNEVIERKRIQLAQIIEQHVMSRAV